MSRRFGRQQKRKMRAQIAELDALRKDAGRWAALESAVEDGGLVIALENGKTGTIKLGKGNLRQGIDAAIAGEKNHG